MILFLLCVLLVDVKVLICEEIFFSENEISSVLKMSNILSDSNFSTFAFLYDSQERDLLDTQFTFNSAWSSNTNLKAIKIINLK